MSGGDTIGKYFSFTVEISQTGFNLAVCVGFVSLSDKSGIESAKFLSTPQHMKIIIHCKLVCFLTQTFATELSGGSRIPKLIVDSSRADGTPQSS